MLETFGQSKRAYATQRKQLKETRDFYPFWKWMSRFFLAVLLVLLGIWGWMKLQEVRVLPVKNVQIIGAYTHVNKLELQQTILPFVDKGFFNVDLSSLRDQLL